MATSAREALDLHMDAVNSWDAASLIDSQHFPFVHLWPDGSVQFMRTGAEFELPDAASLGADWHHTALQEATEITRCENAVSYRVVFTRHRADDSIYGRYEAVWVVTKVDDDWRVQFRHGAIDLRK